MRKLIILFTLWTLLSSIASTNALTIRFINDREVNTEFEFYSTDGHDGWHLLNTYVIEPHDTIDMEVSGYCTLYGYREVSDSFPSVFKIVSPNIKFK